jgi:hypothetical protein
MHLPGSVDKDVVYGGLALVQNLQNLVKSASGGGDVTTTRALFLCVGATCWRIGSSW